MTPVSKSEPSPEIRGPRWPNVGDVLVHRFSDGRPNAEATVVYVDPDNDSVHVRVGNTIYTSLSAAAKGVSGQHTNGWIFWGLKKQQWHGRGP